MLADRVVRPGQQHARAVAERRARRVHLFERAQPGGLPGQLVLALAGGALAPQVFAAGLGQVGLVGRLRRQRRVQRRLRVPEGLGGAILRLDGAAEFGLQVGRFDLQPPEHRGTALPLRGRVLDRGGERGHGVDDRVNVAAGPLDRLIGRLDRPLGAGERFGRLPDAVGGRVAGARGLGHGGAALVETQPIGLATLVEPAQLGFELGDARLEHRRLLGIERELLLATVDVELAGVGVFAHPGGVLLGLSEFETHPRQFGFDLGQPRRRRGLVLAGVVEAGARRLDVLGQMPVAAGEQHLLPAPHLVTQTLEPAGLGRLPLERAALLLDLEDDVVEAGEVLLGGVELELSGAAARLVLGDAGGFLDQLTAVGRPRAQDHPDLALLDDRVGLGAEPGVHQQLVDVAKPAVSAVDEVLALARAIQPPRHLDVAHRLKRIELEGAATGRRPRRGRSPRDAAAAARRSAAASPPPRRSACGRRSR